MQVMREPRYFVDGLLGLSGRRGAFRMLPRDGFIFFVNTVRYSAVQPTINDWPPTKAPSCSTCRENLTHARR